MIIDCCEATQDAVRDLNQWPISAYENDFTAKYNKYESSLLKCH